MLQRITALVLLSECTGRDIWTVEYCRQKRVPETWIDELQDCFESGFRTDLQTIYEGDKVVNQYHGIRDLDLAFKLAEYLGVDTHQATYAAFGPEAQVRRLKEAVDE